MKIDGLTFTETVERLAEKYGVELKHEEGDSREERPKGPARGKLIEAHRVAQEFYAEQLLTPEAQQARQFLTERGFDGESAETFGVGFAPRGGDDLFKHLRARGFSADEITVGGLAVPSQRGGSPYDRFRGRLLWPIREASGETIGFGARRIFEDDRVEAKYLNTAETPIYKKSRVLYGIDLARREMGRASQAVVVEGYTDVMACHLAGVKTAVASCGTAFGDEHAKVLRRYMADHEEFRGEVVFTFDGDAAGQAAAIKAFSGDQNFVSQTYVAVEPDGLDPCDAADQEGRRGGPRAGRAPGPALSLRAHQRGRASTTSTAPTAGSTRCARARGWCRASATGRRSTRSRARSRRWSVSMSTRRGPRSAAHRRAVPRRGRAFRPAQDELTDERPARQELPSLRDPRFAIERETLKLVLQHPMAIGRTTSDVGPEDFTHPTYRGVWDAIAASGGPVAGAADPSWSGRLRDVATDPAVASAITELSVEPLPMAKEPTADYVLQHVVRLLELTALRRIDQVKSKLQRTNPFENDEPTAGCSASSPPSRSTAASCATGSSERSDCRMKLRRSGPPVEVAAGERVLAWASSSAGPVAGTRAALYLPDGGRIPWEQVEAADWDLDSETLKVSEVGTWGEPRPTYSFVLGRPRPAAAAGPGAGHRHRSSSSATSRSGAGAACGWSPAGRLRAPRS